MANVNDPYSQNTVTAPQRGRQDIGGADGNAFDAWDTVEAVANAHDQQAAPTHAYEAPLDNNASPLSGAPVADRDAPYNAPRDSTAVTAQDVIYPAGDKIS